MNKATIDRNEIEAIIRDTSRNVLLYGPPGTGKTTLAQHAAAPADRAVPSMRDAWQNGQPVFSWTFSAEQSAASILGHYIPVEDGHFAWHDGPATASWRVAGLFIANEIDHVSEDVSNVLHALLDDPDVAALTLPTRETVHPAPGFRVIATLNGTPADLHPAVLDRFGILIPVTRPSDEMLAVLSPDIRAMCLKMYAGAGSKAPAITYRQLAAFDDMRNRMEATRAATLVTGSEVTGRSIIEALRVSA